MPTQGITRAAPTGLLCSCCPVLLEFALQLLLLPLKASDGAQQLLPLLLQLLKPGFRLICLLLRAFLPLLLVILLLCVRLVLLRCELVRRHESRRRRRLLHRFGNDKQIRMSV